MALTLPIEIGKKYVRRDGKIVITREWGSASGYVTVNTDDESLSHSTVAYRITGRIDSSVGSDRLEDLVADYVEQKGHKHANKMMEYARDAAETNKPWLRWQIRNPISGKWVNCWSSDMKFYEEHEYRRKPRTITINGHEIEAPLRDEPKRGSPYYLVSAERVYGANWVGTGWERGALKFGRVFGTQESAQAAYDAITSMLVPKE